MESTRTGVTTCQPAAWLNVEGEIQPKTTMSFEQFDADFQAAQEMGLAARRKRLGLKKNDSSESHQDSNTTPSKTEPHSGGAISGIGTSTSDNNTISTPIAPPPAPRPAKALLATYESVPMPPPQTLREFRRKRRCSLWLSSCHEMMEGWDVARRRS